MLHNFILVEQIGFVKGILLAPSLLIGGSFCSPSLFDNLPKSGVRTIEFISEGCYCNRLLINSLLKLSLFASTVSREILT